MKRFGRLIAMDTRDQGYLVRGILGPAGVELPESKTWAINGHNLDQGATGTCVGHAWRNWLRCAPIQTEKKGPNAFDIYRGAVVLDEWTGNNDEARLPDNDPGLDYGTSVRAGWKFLRKVGRVAGCVWAFTLHDAVDWVRSKGPLVMGTNWRAGMMDPDEKGMVFATGGTVGGHAYLLRGVNVRTGIAHLTNSWGDGWGKSGDCYIGFHDLEVLMHEGGEACAAVELKPAPTTEPKAEKEALAATA